MREGLRRRWYLTAGRGWASLWSAGKETGKANGEALLGGALPFLFRSPIRSSTLFVILLGELRGIRELRPSGALRF